MMENLVCGFVQFIVNHLNMYQAKIRNTESFGDVFHKNR